MTDQILWYTTRGAGAVSLVLLTAVVGLGVLSSLRFQATGWPRFLTTGLHRNLALVTLVFLGLHIVTAVVDPFTNLGWAAAIIPFSSYYRTFWLGLGTIAAELLAAIVVTSLAREFIGRQAWRVIHWLAYAAWPIGVIHGLGTGTDAWSTWFFALTCGCVAIVGFAAVYRLMSNPSDPLAGRREAFRAAVDRRPRQ
ncbi:MAG TPA: ferric reductase-like transmembrane domain-containing protein [Candidatus Dormibacteraeota bacterium]|nr:ferric reductase-like transmembrane domain-containing protein [Candidatus Dormibacteraeota bacterium]